MSLTESQLEVAAWEAARQQAFDADRLATTPFARETSLAAAKALPSLPTDATKAVIQAEAGRVRWRPDGATTAPTATTGMLLEDGDTLPYVGGLAAVRFIQVDAGALINVIYFTD